MITINTFFSRIADIKTIRSFKIPAYRTYFIGHAGIWASFSMNQVARTYLIYEITDSTAMLGMLTLTSTAPILILSLFGGAIADRFPKKLLIRVSHAGFALTFLGYAIADITGYMSADHPESWWVLLVGGIVMGSMIALSMPARGAILPEIIDRDRLMNAVSLNILGMSFFQMTIPVIAGYIIGSFGYGTIYMLMAGCNVMSFFVTKYLPEIPQRPAENKNVLVDIGQGFKYIIHNRMIMLILIFFVSMVLLVNPLQTLMPVFARDILNVGVEGQGTLLSMMGIGSIGVTLMLASFHLGKRGRLLLLSNLCMGVALITFTFSKSWTLSLIMIIIVGIGRMGTDALGNTLMQMHTDPKILGRVNSIVMVSFGMGGAVSFIIGLLAESIGAPWALGMFAIMLAISSLFALVFMSKFRNLE